MSYGSSWSQNAKLSLEDNPALAYSRFAICQLNKFISSSEEIPPSDCRNVSSAAPREISIATSPMAARRWLALSRNLLYVPSTSLSTSGSTGDPSGRYSGHLSLILCIGKPSCLATTPRGFPNVPVSTLPPRSAAAECPPPSIFFVYTRPPHLLRPSNTITLKPDASKCRAAASPARPAPTTMTVLGLVGSLGRRSLMAGATPKLTWPWETRKL
uniref:Uncharacterized protein n=1 Tax=Triticum urartu TaxID=4572 RepID=A0A8R7PIR8_TRIUA